jgi:hypothetical protein
MEKSLKQFAKAGLLVTRHPFSASRRIMYNVSRSSSDILSAFEYYNYPYRIIFLAGMAMSASTWMKNLLARIPGYYTRNTPMPKKISYYQNICDSAFKYVPKHGYSIFKTHLNPSKENLDCIFNNGVEKVLITYRDLRDVVLSRYHRMIAFPKPLDMGDFIDYNALGKEEAIDNSIEHVAKVYAPWIFGWNEIAKNNPEKYHFTKFEDLKNDTKEEFKKVLQFYDITLSDNKIDSIIELSKGNKSMKKNINAAKVLPGGLGSNFRSGKIGGWRDEMTNIQIEKCKDLLGPSLIKLGYEKDMNW